MTSAVVILGEALRMLSSSLIAGFGAHCFNNESLLILLVHDLLLLETFEPAYISHIQPVPM